MSRLIFFLVAVICAGQNADPAFAPLDAAYSALRSKDYGHAIQGFEQAIALAPDRASIHKDLAYSLLKIGETEAARDQFAEAMRLEPDDDHIALEYAFLCYETKQQRMARRIFDGIRSKGNPTAVEAFEKVDRPLREGIARWNRVLEVSPDNLSAHEELARLAEKRDEPALAAEHYEKAWRLRQDRREVLIDLARAWTSGNRIEDASAALLAASRGAEPRAAEEAQELLPKRYPYVYEFRKALDLDPSNADLRRELAYLYLEMSNAGDAEQQFDIIVRSAPDDLQSAAQLRVLRSGRSDSAGNIAFLDRQREKEPAVDAKQLAEKSLEKGYLKDAAKYFLAAHENDPQDFEVMLKLGWIYNNLKDDGEAVRWFDRASRSPDPQIAAEASHAYHNLEPGASRFRSTVWMFPVFSTRWHDVFGYAQAKTEWHPRHWIVHPYVSARLVGDATGILGPQYLSEQSIILGIGAATVPWRGIMGWFEAGEAFGYNSGRVKPDYRGGFAYSKGFGNLLRTGKHGAFAETNDDGIFVSRFSNDTLLYSQNRTGYTWRETESVGVHAQIYWNWNATVDALGQYWANYVETGPGIRVKFQALPSLLFSVNALRGAYLINQGNPRGPNFNDIRVGIWYAFTK